jgi:hypothetical protein
MANRILEDLVTEDNVTNQNDDYPDPQGGSSGGSSTIDFDTLWKNYPIGLDAGSVYKLIGGKVYNLYLTNPTGYANACALRLSRSFNYGGIPLSKSTSGYKETGSDNKYYLFRVKDMINYVKLKLGRPTTIKKPTDSDYTTYFVGKQGVLIFKVTGWGDATGHVTLWNGSGCGDHCYFSHTDPNVKTVEVIFWEL